MHETLAAGKCQLGCSSQKLDLVSSCAFFYRGLLHSPLTQVLWLCAMSAFLGSKHRAADAPPALSRMHMLILSMLHVPYQPRPAPQSRCAGLESTHAAHMVQQAGPSLPKPRQHEVLACRAWEHSPPDEVPEVGCDPAHTGVLALHKEGAAPPGPSAAPGHALG